ncbi:hypothetical protein [Streptomyces sp. NBC_00859]|uniref:hypothetical protein n=1 Tax=Streptomyces sp. NBC_00859 TaxID=2903682 RepID=UPI00386DD357|nr:hypothetical protein OG584_13910 [Streptomyces sp. NBC_00859]
MLVLGLLSTPTLAYAGGKGGRADKRSTVKGGSGNGKITVQTRIQTTTNGNPGTAKTGSLSSTDSNWTPPACWYEPAFSPKEIQASVKSWREVGFFGLGDVVGNVLDSYYKDGKYKNYNLDQQGKGMFWAAAINPKRKDDPEANSCDKPPFWVPDNTTPDEPLAVSPKILAEYAYDELPVPDTEIESAPGGKSTVNLPTWIWLDKARFKPVSVTASLPGTGLSATTTATPAALHLDPGTDDAEVHPASGDCPLSADKSIGTPYTRGSADRSPPCGVTYLRSSGGGTYPLRATLTWNITWTSTTGEGSTLPPGTYGDTKDVTVQEIQSVNR